MNKIKILDIKIDAVKKDQVLDLITKTIENSNKAQIATVNPEFIVESAQNLTFKKCLNQVQLAVPDGIGIKAAAKFNNLNRSKNRFIRPIQSFLQGILLIGPAVIFYKKYLDTIPEIITGSDLCFDIARLAEKKGFSIYLLGARPGVAGLAAKKLQAKFPKLQIAGTYPGSPDRKEEAKIISKINKSNPDILLVAYGAPQQDLWIKRNINKIDSPLVGIGVGGSFDFIAGFKQLQPKKRIFRAPKIFRLLGLEWLFRFFQEPGKRAKRTWNGVIVFPWLIYKNDLKNNLDNR
jgi:N-acetylglucosaminyldiphosphoundecaprenol N-acetyl-beta-D-mannosaminyltransferase